MTSFQVRKLRERWWLASSYMSITHALSRSMNPVLCISLSGTQDRIVLISGEVETVPHALALVIEHLHASATTR